MSTETAVGGETASTAPNPVNRERRYFLIGATATVGGIGAVGAAIPFVQSWMPSAKARAAGAPHSLRPQRRALRIRAINSKGFAVCSVEPNSRYSVATLTTMRSASPHES